MANVREVEKIPLFQRIRIQLYKDIAIGAFKVGDMIPNEASLMERFNASRTTVRHAISSMVKEGIIVGKPGKGSFVKKRIIKTNVKLRGSFEDILDVAKSTSVKILGFEFVDTNAEISNQLEIKETERVLRVDRVRSATNIPFLYSINYLPENIGKFLNKKDLEEFPIMELLPQKCQAILKTAVQSFGATVSDDHMSQILKVPIGFPLLEIKRITFSTKDRPVNLFLGYFRADLYTFTAIFSFNQRR